MLIIKPEIQRKHSNPELYIGRTYQLIEDAGSMPQYKAGSVFVTAGHGRIVWLASNFNLQGGWDSESLVINNARFKFVEVDLTTA